MFKSRIDRKSECEINSLTPQFLNASMTHYHSFHHWDTPSQHTFSCTKSGFLPQQKKRKKVDKTATTRCAASSYPILSPGDFLNLSTQVCGKVSIVASHPDLVAIHLSYDGSGVRHMLFHCRKIKLQRFCFTSM